MRYRELTPDGDYSVGPASNWLVNTPGTVAQAVRTKMRLLAGEWFLDTDEGLRTRYILGSGTQATRDVEVKRRILDTPGVVEITAYSSQVDSDTRAFTVTATLTTAYGKMPITVTETL